jgi:hypothetical protein
VDPEESHNPESPSWNDISTVATMNPSEQRPETISEGLGWKNRKLNERKRWTYDARIGRTLIKVIKD